MKELILSGRILLSIILASIMSFQHLSANDHFAGRYSIHSNSSLNSTSTLAIKVLLVTDCLLKCLTTPRCLSLNVMKETMATDGKVTCHLFNVTHKTLSLDLDFNTAIDYYKSEDYEDCYELKRERFPTGVHTLRHRNGLRFDAYCDMETEGGGWTIIQKRFNGSVDFARPWVDYKKGFGDVNGEYWLGLDAMHELTKDGISNLRVDMWDYGDHAYAVYSNVKISNETLNYRLDYEALIEGTEVSKDSLYHSKGASFSTYDRDNDNRAHSSCSEEKANAGWWFKSCTNANPNGAYTPGVMAKPDVLYWLSFRVKSYTIQRIEIKVRHHRK